MESAPVTIGKSSFLRISPTWSNSGRLGCCSTYMCICFMCGVVQFFRLFNIGFWLWSNDIIPDKLTICWCSRTALCAIIWLSAIFHSPMDATCFRCRMFCWTHIQ